MEMLTFKIQAFVFAVLLNGLLYLSAARIAASIDSRRNRLSDADRFLIMMGVATVGVLAIVLPMAMSNVLTRWAVFGSTSVVAALTLAVTRNMSQRPFMARLVTDVATVFRTDRLLLIAVAPGVAALTFLLSWAAVRPSFGFDPLNYHLPLVAAIFKSGSLAPVHFPPYFEAFPYFTMNGDMFSLWAILSSGDTSLLAMANIPLYILLGASIYGFARDYLPSRAAAAGLTSALLTVPAFFVLLTDAYVEIPLWAFMFACLRLIILSGRLGHHPGLFSVASFLCGAMVGTKLTGIPMAGVAVAVWLLCTPKIGASRAVGRFAVFMAGAALFGGVFYIRNVQTVGSPMYPFPLTIGGYEVFAGDAEHAARVAGTTIRRFLAPLVFSGELFKAIVGTRIPPNSSWGLGVTGPVIIAAAFSAFLFIMRSSTKGQSRREPWTGLIFLGASLLSLLIYINLPWCAPYLYGNVRFVYPAVPFAALALVTVPGVAGISPRVFVAICLAIQAASFAMASIPFSISGLVVLVGVGCLAFCAVILVRWPRAAPFVRFMPGLAAMLVVLVTVFFRIDPVDAYRDPGLKAGPGIWASERVDCLESLDMALPEGQFLLTMARAAPHAWFIFPLLGERLQREPVYADISRDGQAGKLKSADYIPGYPGADREFWLENVRRSGAHVLVVMNDKEDIDIGRSPVEFEWVRSMPATFVPVHEGRFCSVYSIR